MTSSTRIISKESNDLSKSGKMKVMSREVDGELQHGKHKVTTKIVASSGGDEQTVNLETPEISTENVQDNIDILTKFVETSLYFYKDSGMDGHFFHYHPISTFHPTNYWHAITRIADEPIGTAWFIYDFGQNTAIKKIVFNFNVDMTNVITEPNLAGRTMETYIQEINSETSLNQIAPSHIDIYVGANTDFSEPPTKTHSIDITITNDMINAIQSSPDVTVELDMPSAQRYIKIVIRKEFPLTPDTGEFVTINNSIAVNTISMFS